MQEREYLRYHIYRTAFGNAEYQRRKRSPNQAQSVGVRIRWVSAPYLPPPSNMAWVPQLIFAIKAGLIPSVWETLFCW
ncbi:MAG: hypothetical protein ACRC3G_02160 [Bacteroidales bacterium]